MNIGKLIVKLIVVLYTMWIVEPVLGGYIEFVCKKMIQDKDKRFVVRIVLRLILITLLSALCCWIASM